jgi:phosphoglycolate phosphatase-like HAD superfamily hydrolase
LTSALGYSVKKYLGEKKLLQYFEAVLGFEKQRSKDRSFKKILIKYKVNKEDVLFITDTVGDILEAKKNNLKVVGVGYGFQGKERLAKENPDYMIDCAKEIVEVVNSHFQEIDKERPQGQQLDKLAI